MPWASFSMLDGPSAKTQVSLTRFLQSEVKIIHIIVQNNTYSCQNFESTPTFLHSDYTPCLSQSSRFNRPDFIRWTVQTMKFLIYIYIYIYIYIWQKFTTDDTVFITLQKDRWTSACLNILRWWLTYISSKFHFQLTGYFHKKFIYEDSLVSV